MNAVFGGVTFFPFSYRRSRANDRRAGLPLLVRALARDPGRTSYFAAVAAIEGGFSSSARFACRADPNTFASAWSSQQCRANVQTIDAVNTSILHL
jgi:hypothetical protein